MLLTRELTEIHRRLGLVSERLALSPEGVPAGLGVRSSDEGGPDVDAVVAAEQRELDARERGRLEQRARSIVAALRKIKAGTYGVCEGCGEAIAPTRLRALPDAAFCLGCQADVEHGRAADGTVQRNPRPLVERGEEEA